MKFSICLLTYQRDDDILNCLQSMFAQASEILGGIEFVVVDNNLIPSRIKTLNVPPTVCLKYVHPGKNLGVAGGRNEAAKHSVGEYLIFLDDDVVIPSLGSICAEVSRVFESLSDVGAVAMKVVDHHANTIRDYEIPHPDKRIDMTTSFYTSHCIGAGHAVRSSVFRAINGFDENLGLYGMEEIEFCYKLVGAGWKIIYVPGAEVRHLRSPAGRLQSGDVLYRNFVNKCNIAKRYLPPFYFITHTLIWGFFFVFKTRDI